MKAEGLKMSKKSSSHFDCNCCFAASETASQFNRGQRIVSFENETFKVANHTDYLALYLLLKWNASAYSRLEGSQSVVNLLPG